MATANTTNPFIDMRRVSKHVGVVSTIHGDTFLPLTIEEEHDVVTLEGFQDWVRVAILQYDEVIVETCEFGAQLTARSWSTFQIITENGRDEFDYVSKRLCVDLTLPLSSEFKALQKLVTKPGERPIRMSPDDLRHFFYCWLHAKDRDVDVESFLKKEGDNYPFHLARASFATTSFPCRLNFVLQVRHTDTEPEIWVDPSHWELCGRLQSTEIHSELSRIISAETADARAACLEGSIAKVTLVRE